MLSWRLPQKSIIWGPPAFCSVRQSRQFQQACRQSGQTLTSPCNSRNAANIEAPSTDTQECTDEPLSVLQQLQCMTTVIVQLKSQSSTNWPALLHRPGPVCKPMTVPKQNGYLYVPKQNGYLHVRKQNGYLHVPKQNGYLYVPKQNGYLHVPKQNGYLYVAKQTGYLYVQKRLANGRKAGCQAALLSLQRTGAVEGPYADNKSSVLPVVAFLHLSLSNNSR